MKLMIIVGFMLIAGCASAPEKKMNYLKVGMSKAEVINVMGEPDATKARENLENLVYINEGTIWTWGVPEPRQEYWIILRNGTLVEFGRAEDIGTSTPTRIEIDHKVTTKSGN
jgi:hypothetical protein